MKEFTSFCQALKEMHSSTQNKIVFFCLTVWSRRLTGSPMLEVEPTGHRAVQPTEIIDVKTFLRFLYFGHLFNVFNVFSKRVFFKNVGKV